MRSQWIPLCLLASCLFVRPEQVAAQRSGSDAAFEAIGSIGWGHLFRAEDRTFGDVPSVGGALAIRKGGLGVEFDVQTLLGLSLREVPCAVTVPCTGTAREGVSSSTIVSANVLYYFGDGRVQPFVAGGVGAMWSTSVVSLTQVQGNQAVLSDFEERDTGFAFNVGGGFRIALTPHLALRPEIRIYDSSIQSRANLSLVRVDVGVVAAW
jgi:opacity protein-like surface antigen